LDVAVRDTFAREPPDEGAAMEVGLAAEVGPGPGED
jgi:hypothetical protein